MRSMLIRHMTGPLIKVNCAALPETLLESELFGHEKGAFTNAMTQRKGRFELANKEVDLSRRDRRDEPGHASASCCGCCRSANSSASAALFPIKVDVRVIAATNRDLKAEVEAGRFREDLYYRLNVIPIELPPLRRRKEDIPLLVEHFLDKHRYSSTSQPARISEEAMQKLIDQDWPGNVRELENAVQRAVVLSKGGIITSSHLTPPTTSERAVVDVAQMVREGVQMKEILGRVERIPFAGAGSR